MTIISIRIVVNVYNSLLHIYRVFLFFFVFEGDVAQIFFEAQLDRTSANLSRSPVQYFIFFFLSFSGGKLEGFSFSLFSCPSSSVLFRLSSKGLVSPLGGAPARRSRPFDAHVRP